MGANSQTAKEKFKPELFWPKVKIGLKDECWPYRGSISSWGYGTVMRTLGLGKRFTWGAHKVAWVLDRGPVPDGLCVLHKCDNRACCNPHHLYLGTKVDNARDKIERGRDPTRGEGNRCAKEWLDLARADFEGQRSHSAPKTEQEPVAWRWKDKFEDLHGNGPWRYQQHAPTDQDAVKIEPMYGHPWLRSTPAPSQDPRRTTEDATFSEGHKLPWVAPSATDAQDATNRALRHAASICDHEASLWKSSKIPEPDDVSGGKSAAFNCAIAIRALIVPNEASTDDRGKDG